MTVAVMLCGQALYDTSTPPATSPLASCTPAHAAEMNGRQNVSRSQNTDGSGGPETVVEFHRQSSEQQRDEPAAAENISSAR